MSQRRQWTESCPERIKKRIVACTSSGLKLDSQNDPVKFVVTDSQNRKFRCTVGSPHRCSCASLQPCIHILFILVSFFRVQLSNAVLWQTGVSEVELSEWIADRNESKTCFFCHGTVVDERQCERCEVHFHDRCLQLASAARKYRVGACPKCSAALPVKKAHNLLLCNNCHRPCSDDYYYCLLCDSFCLCSLCHDSSNTHSFHPFSHKSVGASAPPPTVPDACRVEELQYREINPEDYEALISLDSKSSKRLPSYVLSRLPAAKHCTLSSFNQSCPVCQQSFSARDVCLLLPCGHTMHRECGLRWLSQYSDECPIDHMKVITERKARQAYLSDESLAKKRCAEIRLKGGESVSHDLVSLPRVRLSK